MGKKKKSLRAKKAKPVKFNDDTLMYFGGHKGTKLGNLPDHYCRWLLKQDWIKKHDGLFTYLVDNEDCLGKMNLNLIFINHGKN